jgi:hypothetical protein
MAMVNVRDTMHQENQDRFLAIEHRMTVLETTLENGLGVIRWIGMAGIGLLAINVLAHWLG